MNKSFLSYFIFVTSLLLGILNMFVGEVKTAIAWFVSSLGYFQLAEFKRSVEILEKDENTKL